MDLYPNYDQINKFFIDNFDDYVWFLESLIKLDFNDGLKVNDIKQNKTTELNFIYNSKKFLTFENYIVDIYLNIYYPESNVLEIQNYIQFPPYVLYLIKYSIITKPDQSDIKYAINILNLTRYLIFNYNESDNDDDIEDFIYLKNKLKELKFTICEMNEINKANNDLNNDKDQIIKELKEKIKKNNMTLMENQNIFMDLHCDLCEKDQMLEEKEKLIEENKKIIEEKEKTIQDKDVINKELLKNIQTMESMFVYKSYKYFYDIYEGFNIFFSRFRF